MAKDGWRLGYSQDIPLDRETHFEFVFKSGLALHSRLFTEREIVLLMCFFIGLSVW